ncbi:MULTISPECIES: hypothetical protein [Actinoplanes]|uniref:hypothetical protein n=1 Tax=Actinoplanes TaxID=1865 RepID=UPI0012F9DF8C|nr:MULTISPECIES: hypothetical protein [Actinoplanes]
MNDEEAEFRGPVGDDEFDEAADALGRPLPQAWRDYLQSPAWFRQGQLASGAYLILLTPREMLELHEAWDAGTGAHPGIAVIGHSGGREQLALDLRRDPSPVLMVDITSEGWVSGIHQADDVEVLIGRVESGTFDYAWDQGQATSATTAEERPPSTPTASTST